MSLPAKYRESVTGPVFYMLENLYTKSTDQQQAVVSAFMGWFSQKARLRPSPDLDKKIADMEKRLRRMAKNMEIEFENGKLVIKSDADSMALLSLLRRGSSWFDPHPSVEGAVLAALVEGAKAS